MEAKEVMVGDWVKYGNRFALIQSITPNECCILVLCSRSDEIVWETYDNIEPIPLTSEILEKNGFEKSYSSILTADGYKKLPQYKYKNTTQVQDICRNLITISYSDSEGGVYNIQCGIGSHIYDLKYVHQLQHAIKLCGIEKEIEL